MSADFKLKDNSKNKNRSNRNKFSFSNRSNNKNNNKNNKNNTSDNSKRNFNKSSKDGNQRKSNFSGNSKRPFDRRQSNNSNKTARFNPEKSSYRGSRRIEEKRPHKSLYGVFEEKGKIFTKNMEPGKSVYGERTIKVKGVEYRQWEPKRSKLGAAIVKRVKLPQFSKDHVWLYLGCSYGTTVSHLSDILVDGLIFSLDFAHRVIRDFLFMSENRDNIAPIMGDAYHPETYEDKISMVDVLFQDIAQKTQVDIFLKNLKFLRKGGTAIFAVKARSIDVSKSPNKIFEMVRKQIEDKIQITDYMTLEPYEDDHAIFICKK
jgi:fibrillarin-like pre-rRNA processing protein